MKNVRILGAVIGIFFICSTSFAKTYYVGQKKAGDSSGSTYSNRLSVEQHNTGKFLPGDVIYLCGTITSPVIIPSSGAPNNDIIYKGNYSPDPCNIITPGGNAVQLKGRDYITITNIEISSAVEGIVNGSSSNVSNYVTIQNCKIHNAKNRGILLSYFKNSVVGGSKNNGNEIFDCGGDTAGGDVAIGTGAENLLVSYNHLYGNGIDTGVDGVVVESYADGTIIEYNKIHDHWREDGIDLKKARNVIVRFNDVYGHKNQTGITVQMNSNNVRVYGNRIWNNDMGFWIRDGHVGTTPVANIHFYSNIVYNNKQAGVLINSAGEGSPVGPFYIYNNLISDNSTEPESQIYCGIGIAAGTKKIYVKNNILYDNRVFNSTDVRQIYTKLDDLTVLDYNSYSSGPGRSLVYYDSSDKSLAQMKNYSQEIHSSEIITKNLDPINVSTINNFNIPGLNLGSEYSIGIDPYNTDWEQNPPRVEVLERIDGSWSKGPYVYDGNILTSLLRPKNVEIITK